MPEICQVDPTFEKRFEELRAHAAARLAEEFGNRVPWCRPSEITDIYNPTAISAAYSREELNEQLKYRQGTTGDTIVIGTMIPMLASLERAVLARYTMSRPRTLAHSIGRAKNHSRAMGPVKGIVDYVSRLTAKTAEG